MNYNYFQTFSEIKTFVIGPFIIVQWVSISVFVSLFRNTSLQLQKIFLLTSELNCSRMHQTLLEYLPLKVAAHWYMIYKYDLFL